MNIYRGYRAASASAAYASKMALPPSMQGSLPAVWLAFTGRELNPLDRDERFQITFSFSFPGFVLALRKLYPRVLMMQPGQNGRGDKPSRHDQSRVIHTSRARSLPRSRRRCGARLRAMLS